MNPYESPASPLETGEKRSKLRARVIWGSLALLFFLLPSISTSIVHLQPLDFLEENFTGDHFLGRMVRAFYFPTRLLLLVAFLGASGSLLMTPMKLSWRILAAIAVAPLLVCELVAIASVLVLCGRLSG
jgi:hypothetical protein